MFWSLKRYPKDTLRNIDRKGASVDALSGVGVQALWLFSWVVAGVAIVWYIRRRIGRSASELRKKETDLGRTPDSRRTDIFLGDVPEAPIEEPRVADRVEASALVPPEIQPDVTFRLEVVIARQGTIAEAVELVRAGRIDLIAAQAKVLTVPVQRNSVMEIGIECEEAISISPPLRRIMWSGEPHGASFQIHPPVQPRGAELLIDVNIFIDRVCIGYLPLTLPFVPASTGSSRAAIATGALCIPERIFMSYTGADRAYVMPIARALNRLGIHTFMDRLSLQGGESWESRLYEEIDACDCFMLFWSQQSARSDWVKREALAALERRRASSNMMPKIVTHILGPPPPAPAPDGLEALHFNDPAFALWEMAVAEASKR